MTAFTPGFTSSALARYHETGILYGAHHSGGVVGKAIQWQTDSDVSHISAVRADGVLVESLQPQGVQDRRRLVDVPERVDLYLLPCTTRGKERAWAWAHGELGAPYDFAGIVRIVGRFRRTPPAHAWFCSEFAAVMATEAGRSVLHRKEPHHITPGWFVASPLLLPVGSLDRGTWTPAVHDPVPEVPGVLRGTVLP